MSAAAKTFDTRMFELAHGRRPRGEGRWAFATRKDVRAADVTCELPENIEWRTGFYGQVKKLLPAGDWIVLS